MGLVYIFIGFVIIQRLIEVVIANQNAKWMKNQGGYEAGGEHYKYIVALHAFFFVALLIEVSSVQAGGVKWSLIPLVVFLIAQIGRVWALSSLGRFWNTRIMILPGAKVVAKGPYRFMRHPNYVIVTLELLALPLIFQAYWTAIVFSLLNAVILRVRIKEEERALKEATDYEKVFKEKGRFIPSYDE
ncbi:isoprenylcysteine carboxyl methyltransferase family protein [Alkalihalophilus pseudofirmus]|uniref:isoprenylcysteine carboxyl methyltransferase family protein n=1 Tax=Alkalihalophilus pseudofirmus TaxID=79885 RepID=UPI00259B90B5|nr:isoprenylcysteine carboxyl methyltransferase family protein [Alkalihalophilus pseudofirmus]WEG17291.1 isoprenylcysteine carboxyl methyltransferase family protein [Alkalihalophilus pseudofirmus]